MNNKSAFVEEVNKIYKNTGYFDKYGGSFIITLLTFFGFFLLFSYYWVNSQIKPLKADWDNKKCNPAVIPFAGYVNAPPGSSKFDYTRENFNACLFNVLSSIVGKFTRPVYFLTGGITKFFQTLVNMVNAIRGVMDYIRTKIMAMIMTIMERFINVIMPIQIVVLKLKSLLGKVAGIMISGLYTAIGSYYALKSFIGAFLQLIILALVVLAGVVIILWIFPWTWSLAYVGTAAYVALAIPTVIIAIWMSMILDMNSRDVDGCCCFDEHTKIRLKDGSYKSIKDLKIGVKLYNNSFVTSKLKILNTNKFMYNVNGVIVSGTHYIKDYTNTWVKIKNYEKAIKINNYNKEYIYCINTSNKVISIGNDLYLDWDDITQLDIVKLKNNSHINMDDDEADIHYKMEGGFEENTVLETENGNSIKIKNIIPGTILKYEEVVTAVVEIDAKNIKNVKKMKYNDTTFTGKNILIAEDLGVKHSDNIDKIDHVNVDKLYHLITDKGTFYIDGLTFFDYDGCLIQTLDIFEDKKKS